MGKEEERGGREKGVKKRESKRKKIRKKKRITYIPIIGYFENRFGRSI